MVLQCFLYGNHFRPRPVTSDLRLLDFLNKLRQSNTPAKHHQQKQNQPEKKLHLHDGWQANVILARWTWGIVSHDDKVDFDDTSCWFFTKPSEKYAPAQNGQILFPTQLGLKIKNRWNLKPTTWNGKDSHPQNPFFLHPTCKANRLNTNLKGLKASMTYTTLTYWHILVCRDEKKTDINHTNILTPFLRSNPNIFNHQSGLKYPFWH